MHVCCVCVCDACTSIYLCLCMYVCVYVGVGVGGRACMCVCVCVCIHVHAFVLCVYQYTYMYMCMCTVYIYTHNNILLLMSVYFIHVPTACMYTVCLIQHGCSFVMALFKGELNHEEVFPFPDGECSHFQLLRCFHSQMLHVLIPKWYSILPTHTQTDHEKYSL